MKNNYFILVILYFMVSFAFSQNINRIEVFGKIVVDSVDVEAITVYNTSSNKGTITDKNGQFSIKVALNDRIKFSALQFEKFIIVINDAILYSKIMTVFLVEKINKLDEVVLLPYGLSGDLTVDIESVKTFNPNLDALYFGIKNVDVFDFTDDYKSKVLNIAMEEDTYFNGLNLINVIGLFVKPIFNNKKKNRINNSNTYQDLTTKYWLAYLQKNLNISENKINDFVYYIEDIGFDKGLMDEGKELQFLEFLINQSKEFQKIKNKKN